MSSGLSGKSGKTIKYHAVEKYIEDKKNMSLSKLHWHLKNKSLQSWKVREKNHS